MARGRTATARVADVLRAALGGEVVGPGDAAYEQLRRTFDARVDARPAAIARCRAREDAAAALAVGAEHGLPVAVRAGGTSDEATVEGGIVLDVSAMDGVEVDPASRTARVAGGATWAALDEATAPHGLAVTGGRISRMGVVGVALGEGSGWLERALGPTGASVIGGEVVQADGHVVEAGDPRRLAQLRRAGPAVVTRIDLRLHPVGSDLVCGLLGFSRDRAREVATAYRDAMAGAPGEVGGGLLLGAGRGGQCTIVFCHTGPPEAGQDALAPLLALRPSLKAVARHPYPAFQRIWDAAHPPGVRAHLRRVVLRELSDDALAAVVAGADRPAAALTYAFLRPLGGALPRVPPGGAAGHPPDASWACHGVGLWPPVPALDPGQVGWVDGLADAIAPHAAGRRARR